MNIFGMEIPDQIILLAIVGVIVIVFFKFFKGRGKDYPRKDIDVEAPKEFEDMIKTSGQKVFGEKYKLYDGPIKLGRITAMTPIHFDSEFSLRANMKKNREKEKIIAQIKKIRGEAYDESVFVENFYLFEVIKDSPIAKIIYLLGFGKKYHLVEQSAITEGYKQYSINLYMQPVHYFKNVYIYSQMAKAVALNIADRLTLKQTLNGVINFIPKMDYIEMKTANYAAKAREWTDIKDKSWKKREENLEKEAEA